MMATLRKQREVVASFEGPSLRLAMSDLTLFLTAAGYASDVIDMDVESADERAKVTVTVAVV